MDHETFGNELWNWWNLRWYLSTPKHFLWWCACHKSWNASLFATTTTNTNKKQSQVLEHQITVRSHTVCPELSCYLLLSLVSSFFFLSRHNTKQRKEKLNNKRTTKHNQTTSSTTWVLATSGCLSKSKFSWSFSPIKSWVFFFFLFVFCKEAEKRRVLWDDSGVVTCLCLIFVGCQRLVSSTQEATKARGYVTTLLVGVFSQVFLWHQTKKQIQTFVTKNNTKKQQPTTQKIHNASCFCSQADITSLDEQKRAQAKWVSSSSFDFFCFVLFPGSFFLSSFILSFLIHSLILSFLIHSFFADGKQSTVSCKGQQQTWSRSNSHKLTFDVLWVFCECFVSVLCFVCFVSVLCFVSLCVFCFVESQSFRHRHQW